MRLRLAPVDPWLLRSLRDHVHDALRRAIVSGELPAGSFLNERQMAEELGTSTTPVKEALRKLEGEGLIVTEARRGVRVTFDRRQAEEMALARAAIESMIARLAAERIDTPALDALDAIYQRMAAATAARDGAALIVLNEAFHEAIHAASGSHYLLRLLAGQRIYDDVTRTFLMSQTDERDRALAEHGAILASLKRRSPGDAETAMRSHIERSGRHHAATIFARREPSATEEPQHEPS